MVKYAEKFLWHEIWNDHQISIISWYCFKYITCYTIFFDKNGHLLGSYHIYICVFLNPLWISVPRVKILFFTNNYFLVCILKYRTSLHKFNWYLILILGQKFSGTVFYHTIFFVSDKSPNREQKQQQQKRVGAFD